MWYNHHATYALKDIQFVLSHWNADKVTTKENSNKINRLKIQITLQWYIDAGDRDADYLKLPLYVT